MAPSNLLALDLGTKTGWAMRRNGQIFSGTENFTPSRFEGGGMRYLRFTEWLDKMITLSGGVKRLAYEEVHGHVGTAAAHVYGGFLSHLQVWGELHTVPFEGVPVQTIKKHVTGKGNAGKKEVMAWASKQGYSPKDDNEADALAILHLMIANEGSAVPATAASVARKKLSRSPR